MEALTKLTHYNWFVVVSAIIAAMIAFKFLSELWDWFVKRFGIQTKGLREKQEVQKLLEETAKLANKTSKGLDVLEKQYKADEKGFRERLDDHIKESKADRKELHDAVDKLTQIVLDKKISDYRWEIIKLADEISEGRVVGKECLKHAIATHAKYEEIITENGLTNGEVDISIEIIQEEYKKKLREGA